MSDTTIDQNPEVLVALNNINRIVAGPTIRPLYPVRYAYANFFEESLAAPSSPPPLKQLLGNSDVKQSQGYLARVLRPGWVYIKEEDGKGYFHVFKYEQIVVDDQLEERFPKFQFANGINAQGGLKQDKSGSQAGGYPFVFVRKDVTDISIAYSEHEWHPNVIDEMNANADARKKAMQRVSLVADDDATVEATSDNLSDLVEDYRAEQRRVLTFKNSEAEPDLEDVALDVLTTAASYDIQPDLLAAKLKQRSKNLKLGKTARIVGLFDPVGRQKDIAEIHVKLALWEREFSASHVYPYTIGSLVKQLKENDDEQIQEMLRDSISWAEHDQYWGEMDEDIKLFRAYQAKLADLYAAFMQDQGLTGKVGSLDHYFKYFFCKEASDSDDINQEVQKFCNVSEGIFSGILASAPGSAAFYRVAEDMDSEDNALRTILEEGLIKLVTTTQYDVDWSKTTASILDHKVLTNLAQFFAHMLATAEYGVKAANREAHKGMVKTAHFIAKTFMPWVFEVYGVRVKPGEKAKLTTKEIAKTLSRYIDESMEHFPKQSPGNAIQKAQAKLGLTTRLFDWGDEVEKRQIGKLREVTVFEFNAGRHTYVVPKNASQTVGLLADSAFAGISTVINLGNLYGIMIQTTMDKTDPLAYHSEMQDVAKIASATFAIVGDTLTASRGIVGIGARVSQNMARGPSGSQLAKALAPRLRLKGMYLTKILGSKLISGAVAFANLASAADAFWSAYTSSKQGNREVMRGHILVGVGSTALFGLATYAFFAGASSGVGVVIGTVISLGLVIAGSLMVLIHEDSDFERLLKNCFWGSGSKYAFWGASNRFHIKERLRLAQKFTKLEIVHAYQRELQEFMNYFYQPSLEVDRRRDGEIRTYRYTFRLPGFQDGISDISYSVRAWRAGGAKRLGSYHHDYYTELFKMAFQGADIKREQDGVTIIDLQMKTQQNIQLSWFYQPTPDVIAPRRYLIDDELELEPVIGMLDGEPI